MKYSEIVCDISTKPGDWYFYDEQFRYIRQSAPDQYPWYTCCHILALFVVTDHSGGARVKSWPNFGEAHALI